MLSCIPPTKESLERIKRSTYCGASSNYKPTIVVSGDYAIAPDVKGMSLKTLNGEDSFYTCRLGDTIQDMSITSYQKGDIVYQNGLCYQSKINDNVWSPATAEMYGALSELWEKIKTLQAEQALNYQSSIYAQNIYGKKLCEWTYDYNWWEK